MFHRPKLCAIIVPVQSHPRQHRDQKRRLFNGAYVARIHRIAVLAPPEMRVLARLKLRASNCAALTSNLLFSLSFSFGPASPPALARQMLEPSQRQCSLTGSSFATEHAYLSAYLRPAHDAAASLLFSLCTPLSLLLLHSSAPWSHQHPTTNFRCLSAAHPAAIKYLQPYNNPALGNQSLLTCRLVPCISTSKIIVPLIDYLRYLATYIKSTPRAPIQNATSNDVPPKPCKTILYDDCAAYRCGKR